jgi:hypothetical protein
MQINIDEQLMTLAEVARYVPRQNGRKVHLSTLYRWSTIGCRGVILETLQAGATRVSSREAVARFFERLTMAARGQAARTEGAIALAADEARVAKELDAAGI